MNKDITFYYEWIKEDKKELRILTMIAEQQGFKGSLADICRYFNRSPQNKTKNTIKESIEKLSESRFITVKHSGNTWELEIIPQDTEIHVDHSLYMKLITHDYKEKIAWEAIVKVLMWLTKRGDERHKDREIAVDINYSEDTVGDAKAVLENHYKMIDRKVARRKVGNDWWRNGQYIDVRAWPRE